MTNPCRTHARGDARAETSVARASRRAMCVAACLAALALPTSASAQVSEAKFGQQFLSVGFAVEPGLLVDDQAPEGVDGLYPASITYAPMLRVGIHHIVSAQFMMSAELDAGFQWVNDHTATPEESRGAEFVSAFDMSIVGRFIPSGTLSGFHVGAGLNWFRANLEDAPAQILGADLRLGALVWQNDETVVVIDAGYVVPLIQGLELPTDFTGEANPSAQTWWWHRVVIGAQVNF